MPQHLRKERKELFLFSRAANIFCYLGGHSSEECVTAFGASSLGAVALVLGEG